MKAKPNFIDTPEFDEFFRRGEESTQGADSLQPVADLGSDVDISSDADLTDHFARTPAQIERRARFVKYVSRSMVLLTLCLACTFTYKALQGDARSQLANFDGPAPHQVTHRMTNDTSGAPQVGLATPDPPQPGEKVVTEQRAPTILPMAADVRASEPLGPAISPTVEVSDAPKSPVANDGQRGAKSDSNAVRTEVVPKKSPTVAIIAADRSRKLLRATGSSAKVVGPKPEGYRPPTASFSD